MNILIIGSGAREHAIACAFSRSAQTPNLFCIGTTLNPGIKKITQDYYCGDITDLELITELADKWQINLAIIGPEAALLAGVADRLWQKNIPTIGPKQQLAQIETSKIFARELLHKYQIPGNPRFKQFTQLDGVEIFLQELGENNYVIKANGLAGGKGVKVAGEHLFSIAEALVFAKEILAAHGSFIIEEKLIGQEFSLMCFCDGQTLIPMPLVQDHKRAFVDDTGPNTGGMGSYSDANHSLPFLLAEEVAAAQEINQQVIAALSKELKDKYIGILYGSFIATKEGVYVIEFNARFGDPESLNVLTILQTDFVKICLAMVQGELNKLTVEFAQQATVCKYVVPEGYPAESLKDAVINIDEVNNISQLYLGSVHLCADKMITAGSRTAAYVGVADSISLAEEAAEIEISKIKGPLFHREDIGKSQLIEKRMLAMLALRSPCV